jgi:hypothetical protein
MARRDARARRVNYHSTTDAPDAVHWRTLEDAIAVCDQLLRERAREAGET